jgi:hypothetical protein
MPNQSLPEETAPRYRRLRPADAEAIAAGIVAERSNVAIAAELGVSETTVRAARKREPVLGLVAAIRADAEAARVKEAARVRHVNEEAARRARRAAEVAERHGVTPQPGREVETAARVERRSAGGDGKLLGIFSVNGPMTAGQGQDPIKTHWKSGSPAPYIAWLDARDAAKDPALRAAREYENARADAIQHLSMSIPHLRGSDNVLRPVEIALELEPELQPVVDELRARIAESRAAKEAASDAAVLQAEKSRQSEAEWQAARDAGYPEPIRDGSRPPATRRAVDSDRRRALSDAEYQARLKAPARDE